ncbi:MAG: PRC-barrel domain-containing protein [Methanosphaera sp.]|nr:PRC-barrel domain-containing protein [Methanosphaera sp.]
MKSTQIIGKKVLDVNAHEIGKINDIELDVENSKIVSVYLSGNEITLKKRLYEICPENIRTVGDYVLLNVDKKEIIKEQEPQEVLDAEIVNPEELEDED